MISGQCLCGAHRFQLEGALEFPHHCHCGYCRKQHGSAFATLVGIAADRLHWDRGDVIRYRSSADFERLSCASCGTPLPQQLEGFPVFVPAGCLDGLQEAIAAHIFAAFKAPWYQIADGLPRFDAFPPGIEFEPQPTRPVLDPPGGVRGSCLCGDIRFAIEGEAITARHCHCQRCRRARGAAHASNLVLASDGLRFSRGEESIQRYKLPEAKRFTQCFCGRCGGAVPMVDLDRRVAVVPLGVLDDPPPIAPQEHIWTAEIPAWSAVHDDLPQHPGPPSGPTQPVGRV